MKFYVKLITVKVTCFKTEDEQYNKIQPKRIRCISCNKTGISKIILSKYVFTNKCYVGSKRRPPTSKHCRTLY